LKTFEPLSPAEIDHKLDLASRAFEIQKRTSFQLRSERMRRAAQILDDRKEEFARLMTIEMGKPIKAARQEAEKCARVCRYYADNAQSFLSDEFVLTEASASFVAYQPLGVILAVMPWNFPFWQVFRFAAPALMAGNVGVLKHASNVPQCALAIEEIFLQAGFERGTFQTLLIGSSQVQQVLEDPRVVAATLTGSEGAGSSVAEIAGKHIKKTVLELGGSDPFVVMPSADLDEAARTGVIARTINNGQSCIAAKRFIVHEAVFDEFLQRFSTGMQSLRIGDPMDEEVQIGPLATADVLETLAEQVDRSVAMGAKAVAGGQRLDRPGNFYAPTVLIDIPKGSPAWSEELFGPVAIVFRVKNIDEAISVANSTQFGLGSSAWTNDAFEQEQFIRRLEAGSVFINSMVVSDPRLPFGGIKRSGYGRELSEFGIREFVNIKSAWINGTRAKEQTYTE
jgi:succinate-semialdehyde dehydrogenase / glutarate-semialdehyde dehydrogenase